MKQYTQGIFRLCMHPSQLAASTAKTWARAAPVARLAEWSPR
jgi:hypothetical protein